ncbi:MAG: hypothetical protein CMJ78_07285 [Planctomycetaceae bacterium]|nr:hypothetical protein [Planctomycetaceae bacterium]
MAGAQLLFLLFALATCASAVMVVVSQNVVRMAFWLIISLGSTSALYFLLHADFVGATQLLVYVGGTLVLLVFGVMLTASGPHVKIKMSPAEGFLAAGVGCLFLAMIFFTVIPVANDWDEVVIRLEAQNDVTDAGGGYNALGEGNTTRPLGLSFLGTRPDKDLNSTSGTLSTGYLLPFEIVSVHLLVVLIGAAYLARAKRRVDAEEA